MIFVRFCLRSLTSVFLFFALLINLNSTWGQVVDVSTGDVSAEDQKEISAMLMDLDQSIRIHHKFNKADYLTSSFVEDIEAEVIDQSSEKDRARINNLLKNHEMKGQLAGLEWSFGARIQQYTQLDDGYEVALVMSSSFGFDEKEHSLIQDAHFFLLVVREDDKWKIADISDQLIRLYIGCFSDSLPMVMYFSQALDKNNNRRGLAISFGTEEAAVIDFSLSDYQN